MLPAILHSLPIAVGVLLASAPLIAVSLILVTRGDRKALLAFLGGWGCGFLVLGSLVFLVVDVAAHEAGTAPGWVNGVRVLLGLLLLGVAWRQWRQRPRAGVVASPPGWMQTLDTMGPARAAGLGFMLLAVNPKNMLLVVSGAVTIASTTLLPWAQLGALLVFATVASLGVAWPLLAWLLFGQRALPPLQRFKAGIIQHNAVIMAVVLAVLGLVLAANGWAQWLGSAQPQ